MKNILVMKTEDDFARVHQDYGGSSYAAALFGRGYQDMPSFWSVWAHFSGKLDDVGPDEDMNARVRLGKLIEPAIAAEVCHRTGWDLLEGRTYWSWQGVENVPKDARIFVMHEDRQLPIGATCDRYVREHEDGPGIIELKNRDYLQWLDSYTDDDASIRDRIQLAHQFLVHPDIQWGAIAALVGGNDLKLYRYTRADLADMIEDIHGMWKRLWNAVKTGNEPDITASEVPAWLKAHDEQLGVTEETKAFAVDLKPRKDADDMTFDDWVESYRSSTELAKTAKKNAEEAKAVIVQELDGHKFGRSNRFRIKATYVKTKASVVMLPDEMQVELRRIAEGPDRMPPADVKRVCELAASWATETRRAGTQCRLTIDHDPMDDQGGAINRNGAGKPTADQKQAAQDFQKPLDQ